MQRSKIGNQTISICVAMSLIRFHRRMFRSNVQNPRDCNITMPEMTKKWRTWNTKITRNRELFSQFPKVRNAKCTLITNNKLHLQGVAAPTLSSDFRSLAMKLAGFLQVTRKYSVLACKVAFLTVHPEVNEQLLKYAVNAAVMSRPDTSNDLIRPLMDDFFFDKNICQSEGEGEDYQSFSQTLFM